MKILGILNPLYGTLLAIFLVTLAYGQRLDGVPIFVPEGIGDDRGDYEFYARVLKGGDGDLVPEEYVIWRYVFPWTAREINGHCVVDLVENKSLMVFLEDSPDHVKVMINGMVASIKKPRNIPGVSKMFKFASVSISKANKAIILHRLGEPDKASTASGENWFLYSRTVTKTRKRSNMAYGRATGTIDIDGLERKVDLDTTTYVYDNEKIIFQPYCFKVHFDNNGGVIKVEDLADRAAQWVKE
jgi:hypothetical protein